MLNRKSWLMMSTAAVIAVAPMVAFGQTATTPHNGTTAQAPRDGAPGNPPSTATQRALDGVTGNRTSPDGTGNNPAGTAAGRAVDRATDGSTTAPRTAQGTPATGTAPTGSAPTGTTATGATTPSLAADGMAMRESRRASQIIGSNIYNDENTSIGEVDDLIVPRNSGTPVAVISVGGFLGIGAKLVAIPYDRLTWNADRSRWVLPGATKDSLKTLPAFDYASMRGNG